MNAHDLCERNNGISSVAQRNSHIPVCKHFFFFVCVCTCVAKEISLDVTATDY